MINTNKNDIKINVMIITKEIDGAVNKSEHTYYTNEERVVYGLIDRLRPTHFITISLKQARTIANGDYKTFVVGDDIIYNKVFERFINSLSKQACTPRRWKSQRPILQCAGAIEGGVEEDGHKNQYRPRYHLHLMIKKPDDLTEEQFRIILIRTASGNNWIMNGKYSIDIKSIDESSDVVNKMFYTFKRGFKRLLMS